MLRPTALEAKKSPIPPTLLRSPVSSVAHNPRRASSLAATLHSGVVLLWDTRKEALDSHLLVRTHSNALAHGAFHPHLPLYLTLSTVGDLDIWPICSGPDASSQAILRLEDCSRTPTSVAAASAQLFTCVLSRRSYLLACQLQSVRLSVCVSVRLFVCQSVCPCLFVCLPVCLRTRTPSSDLHTYHRS